MKSLIINDKEITLIRSKRKSLGLEVGPEGIKARAPKRMHERDIIAFIQSKENWLNNVLDKLPQDLVQQRTRLVSGAELFYQGMPLRLIITEGSRAPVTTHNGILEVPVANTRTPLEQRVRNKIIKWYKQQAMETCSQRASHFAPWMSVRRNRPRQITVRDYKRRWGSCDSNGKLSFNWRIIQAPPCVLDYVVIHELAHLKEFNHSKAFWALVSQQMPDYKEHELWLSQRGYSLYRI